MAPGKLQQITDFLNVNKLMIFKIKKLLIVKMDRLAIQDIFLALFEKYVL